MDTCNCSGGGEGGRNVQIGHGGGPGYRDHPR